MDISANPVDEAESHIRNEFVCRVPVDRRALDGRVVDEHHLASRIGAEAVEQRGEDLDAERVIKVDKQVAAREREAGSIGPHEPNIAACDFTTIGGPIIFGDFVQRGRNLDADNLPERAPCRMQKHASEARAHIDERGPFGCQRYRVEQAVDVGDRRRFIVCCEFEARSDGLGIEFAEEDQGFGGDPVLGIEALTRAPAQWTSALASVSSMPSASILGPRSRTAASVAGRG